MLLKESKLLEQIDIAVKKIFVSVYYKNIFLRSKNYPKISINLNLPYHSEIDFIYDVIKNFLFKNNFVLIDKRAVPSNLELKIYFYREPIFFSIFTILLFLSNGINMAKNGNLELKKEEDINDLFSYLILKIAKDKDQRTGMEEVKVVLPNLSFDIQQISISSLLNKIKSTYDYKNKVGAFYTFINKNYTGKSKKLLIEKCLKIIANNTKISNHITSGILDSVYKALYEKEDIIMDMEEYFSRSYKDKYLNLIYRVLAFSDNPLHIPNFNFTKGYIFHIIEEKGEKNSIDLLNKYQENQHYVNYKVSVFKPYITNLFELIIQSFNKKIKSIISNTKDTFFYVPEYSRSDKSVKLKTSENLTLLLKELSKIKLALEGKSETYINGSVIVPKAFYLVLLTQALVKIKGGNFNKFKKEENEKNLPGGRQSVTLSLISYVQAILEKLEFFFRINIKNVRVLKDPGETYYKGGEAFKKIYFLTDSFIYSLDKVLRSQYLKEKDLGSPLEKMDYYFVFTVLTKLFSDVDGETNIERLMRHMKNTTDVEKDTIFANKLVVQLPTFNQFLYFISKDLPFYEYEEEKIGFFSIHKNRRENVKKLFFSTLYVLFLMDMFDPEIR